MADKISGNVVQIQDYAGSTKKSGTSRSSRLLQDCRDTVLGRAADALARAMDNVDDSLFALADKASNNTLQSHYFDAMREIRIIRKDIESSFKEHFKEKSDELIENRFSSQLQSKAPSVMEIGLSLVEDDDLEESLAINTLIDKIGTFCHAELYGLDKRVGLLQGVKELETEANPIGPKTICNAFKAACGRIESGVDIKLIVFKLIDRYICETIQHVYRDINNHLAMSGILPKIPTQIGGGNAAEGVFISGAVAGQGANNGETDFLSAFSQLITPNGGPGGATAFAGTPLQGASNIAMHHPIQGMPGAFQPAMPGAPGMIPGSGSVMPTTLQSLTLMQKGQWDALGMDMSAIDPAAVANGTSNVLWGIKNSPLPQGGDNGDEMIIEIVALLFDYIFENQKVPDKAKALIGRLQIPVLKAAILDNTFFSMRNHPVRRLLNTLAQSSVGLLNEDGEGSPLYEGIAACVQKILDEFDADIGVFEEALVELESLIENHQSHFDENIEEAKKLIQGRERLMIAESMSVEEIERRLEGKPFPQFIKTFAMEDWKNLLIVSYMKEGQDSDAWKSKVEMLDLLIWSTLPKPTLKDRKKLVDMLPTLLSGLEDGMKLMAMDPGEQDKFMEKLADCHARLVNSEAQITDTKERDQATSMTGIEDGVKTMSMDPGGQDKFMEKPADSHAELVDPEARNTDTMEKEPATPMNSKVNILTAFPSTEESAAASAEQHIHKADAINVEEIKILGDDGEPRLDDDRQDAPERLDVRLNLFGEDDTSDLEKLAAEIGAENAREQEQAVVEDECTELVRNMVPGIWFEFHQEDGTRSMERLAWISSVLGSYLFTNHEGLKTRELSTQEVEESLRTGRAVLADDLSFLVDSTFNSLLDDMQKKQTG